MSKHTPGPWSVYDRGIGFEVVTEDGETVNQGFRGTFDEGDANLIAAAPELLLMAYDSLEFLDGLSEYDQPLMLGERLRQAIARAEGLDPETAPASTEPDLAGGNA